MEPGRPAGTERDRVHIYSGDAKQQLRNNTRSGLARANKARPNEKNVMSPCTELQRVLASSLPSPSLPLDPLLEIVARADAATIVRCAATSKLIRRALQDEAFRRRIALRGEAGDGRLLGVSYALLSLPSSPVTGVGQAPRQGDLVPFDAGLLRSFEPVASREGLVVLRQRDRCHDELRVCNTILNGHALQQLPPADVKGGSCALLMLDDAGRSFKLLVADEYLQKMQVFSTEDGRWGAVVDIELGPYHPGFRRPKSHRFSNPVVLEGRTVHWLRGHGKIMALDSHTARATSMELPPGCCSRVRCAQNVRCALQLAVSADGSLSLVVAEVYVISMWTQGSTTWTRHVVIKRHDIAREFTFWVRFLGFGEMSGTVIMLMADDVGLVQINLRTKDALVLGREIKAEEVGTYGGVQMCLHEIYLPSVLLAMKAF
jgi:hypothetical protein